MLYEFLRNFLISAAALLTVTGSLTVFCGADQPLASMCAEAEDAEEDECETSFLHDLAPSLDTIQQFLVSAIDARPVGVPLVAGLHSERGPPKL